MLEANQAGRCELLGAAHRFALAHADPHIDFEAWHEQRAGIAAIAVLLHRNSILAQVASCLSSVILMQLKMWRALPPAASPFHLANGARGGKHLRL